MLGFDDTTGSIRAMFRRRLPIQRPILVAALAAVPWALALGCVYYQPIVYRPATLGQELESLEAARQANLLTEQEYATKRAELIEVWKAIDSAPIFVDAAPRLKP